MREWMWMGAAALIVLTACGESDDFECDPAWNTEQMLNATSCDRRCKSPPATSGLTCGYTDSAGKAHRCETPDGWVISNDDEMGCCVIDLYDYQTVPPSFGLGYRACTSP